MADAKRQGVEEGLKIGDLKHKEEVLQHAVPELVRLGLDAEKIAAILNLELEAVHKVLEGGESA